MTASDTHDSAPRYDVFNGDADGICALHQLRLHDPAPSTLITGVKRHTKLLAELNPPPGARVTVLDIGFKRNAKDVRRLLDRGCQIRYFDHHAPGEVHQHPALEVHIDASPMVCTSLLVDRTLAGAYRAWAVTAAFGDNLRQSATEAAAPLGLPPQDLGALRELGELLNYNAYGDTLDDLHFHPADLYRAITPYEHPLAFSRNAPQVAILREGYRADMAAASDSRPLMEDPVGRVLLFPGEPWARRVQGVYANQLANEKPGLAHALAVINPDGTLRISIRAPLERPQGAEILAGRYPNGGGRAGASGINHLPQEALSAFIDQFRQTFSRG